MPTILIITTSHDKLGDTGESTGLWLEELAVPYSVFHKSGCRIALASTKGGRPPIDPKSKSEDTLPDGARWFMGDHRAQSMLDTTMELSQVDPGTFDGLFYPGGHGPMWDLAESRDNAALLNAFLQNGKPVGAVCHGPAALTLATRPDGMSILHGKRVTGFSNAEENAVGLDKAVPFLLETRLKELGGVYSAADLWQPHVVNDGLLVTGQNPASSQDVAELLASLLKR